MIKLILSTICLIWSLNVFSQTDTTSTTLPNKILREVAKDLIRYDGCKEELSLANQKIEKMTEIDLLKDQFIGVLNQKDNNNQFIIQQQELQIFQYQKMTDDLIKEINSEKNKTLFWRITAGVAIIAGGTLLITK
jgi:TolA-binding protein